MSDPLRFGVMCAGPVVEDPYAAAVEELLRTPEVELALVIEDEEPAPGGRRGLWDRWLARRPARGRGPVDLSAAFAGVATATARDLEAIREQRLGFVLLLRPGSAGTELLGVAAHGVWSLNLSAQPLAPGAPPGFWEIHSGEPATGAYLQRLTGAGAGAVLHRCYASTRLGSYEGTLEELHRACAFMPARVARDVINGTARASEHPTEAAGPERTAPTGAQVALFLWRKRRAWARAQLRAIFTLERWHVGVVRAPIHRFLDEGFEPAVEWLPNPRARGFLADPFLMRAEGGTRMLMEEWDDRHGRGSIAEADLDGGPDGRRPRTALAGGTHLSYPYLFEHEGSVVCTPESADRRRVVLYGLEHGRWTERATLIEGVAALDPTLVEHDGRWWLFCTYEDDEPQVKLRLWSAPALLGPWTPHPANPVKADVRSSRPAGTPFVHEGELYRPAQDSAGGYGQAVVINRVTLLTPAEFAEEPVARITPPPGSPYRAGAHTLAGLGELTAIDCKRITPAPEIVAARLARKLRVLGARLRGN